LNEYLTIDEGHAFMNEDYIAYINWKASELIKLGYSNEVILLWEDNEFWKNNTNILLVKK